MVWAVQQDLIDRFGQAELLALADRDNDSVIDTAIVGQALNDAQSLAESYVRQRYPAGFSIVPDLLKSLVCDLARFRLDADNPRDNVTRRNDAAIAILRDIASGKASLLTDADGAGGDDPVISSGGDAVLVENRTPAFTDKTLADY